MTNIETISIGRIARKDTLAGRKSGEIVKVRLEAEVEKTPEASTLLFDFSDVGIMTSSFFVVCIWPVVTSATISNRDLFPVLFNVNTDVREDIRIALEAIRKPALLGQGDRASVVNFETFNLDESLEQILAVADRLEKVTAAELYSIRGEVGATAWSNRLAFLYQHRMLRRAKAGRQMVYSLPWRN